jgi:RNA polymerase sigma factor (TIGR02999 family)
MKIRMGVDEGKGHIASLMTAFRLGDRRAADELVEIFQPELRRLATTHMRRERAGHSWQPTLLVNELYLQLVKVKALQPAEQDAGDDRAAFLSLAGLLMRRLLIHHSRPLSQQVTKTVLEEEALLSADTSTLAELDDLLARLDAIRPRLRAIVEMRVFEGLSGDEIAARLDCSPSTVAREWNFARHWIEKQLRPPVRV